MLMVPLPYKIPYNQDECMGQHAVIFVSIQASNLYYPCRPINFNGDVLMKTFSKVVSLPFGFCSLSDSEIRPSVYMHKLLVYDRSVFPQSEQLQSKTTCKGYQRTR